MTIFIEECDPPSDTHKTYTVYFFDESIHTTVTHDATVVTDWINQILEIHDDHLFYLIIGLDVNYYNNNNDVATFQICVGHRCLVYQLKHTLEVPESLVEFLDRDPFMCAGIGIDSYLAKLREAYGIGHETDYADIRDLAAREYKRPELEDAGLPTLARIILEREVMEKPESVKRSRWDRRSLNEDQVMHACLDAFLCFKMGKILFFAYESD